MLHTLLLALAPQLTGVSALVDINTETVTFDGVSTFSYSSDSEVPPMVPADGPDGRFYFAGHTGPHGHELWSTDGTPAGTELVLDIMPGPESSYPQVLLAHAGKVYFKANSGSNDRQVWVTDGTQAGTHLAFSVPKPGGYSPSLVMKPGIGFGGFVYLPIGVSGEGLSVYRTDGTEAGTTVFFGGEPGPEPASVDMTRGVSADGQHFFFESSGIVYSSDGTPAGTFPLTGRSTGIVSLSSSPMVNFNGASYSVGRKTGDLQDGLWRTDGTRAGTVEVVPPEIWNVEGSKYPKSLSNTTVFGGVLYGGYSEWGTGLWKTDGTPGGTSIVIPHDHPVTYGGATEYVELEGELYFLGKRWEFSEPGNYLTRLVATDGTLSGTRIVYNFLNVDGVTGEPNDLTRVGDRMVFSYQEGTAGRELWASDGTTASVQRIADLNTGPEGSSPVPIPSMNPDEILWFATSDSVGRELFVTDGTIAGTSLAVDIDPTLGTGDSGASNYAPWSPTELVIYATDGEKPSFYRYEVGGGLGKFDVKEELISNVSEFAVAWFAGKPHLIGRRDDGGSSWNDGDLFATDGTEAGTEVIIKDWSGVWGHPLDVHSLAGRALIGGAELYVTEGTAASTQSLFGLRVDSAGAYQGPADARLLTSLGEQVYFLGRDWLGGPDHIWRSDGTFEGTERAVPLSGNISVTTKLVVYRGEIIYKQGASDEYGSLEADLMATDGTVAGTRKIFLGEQSVRRLLGVFDGRCYFEVQLDPDTVELWSTDLTVAGTWAEFQHAEWSYLGSTDTHLYWVHGPELQMKSMDAEGNLTNVLLPPVGPIFSSAWTSIGDRGFFLAKEPSKGDERRLFSTDGATVGKVFDIPDGQPHGSVQLPQAFAGDVLVAMSVPSLAGYEIYRLEGDHASSTSFPGGTGALLEVQAPVLGGNSTVRYSGAPAGSVHFVMSSPRSAQPLALDSMCAGCALYVDPDQAVFLAISPALEHEIDVPVPDDPALIGLAVALQVASVDFLGAPDLRLGNGIDAVIGP